MKLKSSAIVRAALSVVLLGSVAIAAFVGVSLVGGGDDGSPAVQDITPVPTAPPDAPTPVPPWLTAYPTTDPGLPTQPADDTNRTPDPQSTFGQPPPSVTISGVEIPIPEGSHYFYGAGGDTRVLHWLWLGDSSVAFDDYGLAFADIKASDEQALTATLDGLWALSQKVATPSPPSVTVAGREIPLPQGSFYSTLDGLADLGNPVIYVVRFHHSMFALDSNGVSSVRVTPADSLRFQATFAAAESLSLSE